MRDQSNQFGGKDGKNTPLYPSLCKRNEKVITKFYLVAGGIDIRVRLKESDLHLSLISIYILDMPSQQIRKKPYSSSTIQLTLKPSFQPSSPKSVTNINGRPS